MRDPYEVLGIQRGATDDEIKKAYRAKCKRWHPDLNPNDPTAEEHFKEVQAAYDAITKGETGPQMGGPSGYGQQSYGGYQQGYSGYQQGYGSNGWQQGDFDFGFDPYHNHVRLFCKCNVFNAEFKITVKCIYKAFMLCQCFKSYGIYKISCVLRHKHVYFAMLFYKHSCKICDFVRRNTSRNSKHDCFSFEHTNPPFNYIYIHSSIIAQFFI